MLSWYWLNCVFVKYNKLFVNVIPVLLGMTFLVKRKVYESIRD